jgi:uncharacterized membrane protein YfcA
MPDIVPFLIDIAPVIAIGMAAQMIDGALGMAFGVITQTLLVSALGVPPATASASVHLVELFTTGASGASHIWHRNVDWGLFRRLVPFGVLGGVAGAYVLSNIDASAARPFVMLYLTGIGFYLLWRAIRLPKPSFADPRYTRPLAAAGGFLDAAGGGGWGPVVTSNLLIQGGDPRKIPNLTFGQFIPDAKPDRAPALPATDVAAMVAFLASAEAGYVTGQVIHVNGGLI